ncbi:FAD-binding oxidoreductase [bacterium]|nr:FAD-binding oxidoreductase [bacterium]
MSDHEQKVTRIIEQLKSHKGNTPVSLKKKAVSHEVPKTKDRRHLDSKIDISGLNKIIEIDPDKRICIAESGVTFVDLLNSTIEYGLTPIIVPELKTITIGGAVAGCSIESMSFRYGGFHDTCTEYEIITANGDVLICTPENENKLLFQMIHGTFGTLGIISKLKFKLIPAKPYVRVEYEMYNNLNDYRSAIWKHFKNKDVEFMDGIIHTASEYVLSLGNFADKAPYSHRYDWMRVYFKSTREREEDYLKTPDYFFRYDKGVTHVNPKSFIGRLLFGKTTGSTQVLRMVDRFHRLIPPDKIPVTIDVFIPFSKIEEFLDWYRHEIDFFPLWCVPYKARNYEWIAPRFFSKTNDELYIDLAIYGLKKRSDKNFYKMLEEELLKIGGVKTLISENYYNESDFWKIWDKENYYKVKQQTDPNNFFRDLYTKTCRTMIGLV